MQAQHHALEGGGRRRGDLAAHGAVAQMRVACEERLRAWRKIRPAPDDPRRVVERTLMSVAGDARACELPAQARIGARQAVRRPRACRASNVPGDPCKPADEPAGQSRDQRRPVSRAHAQPLEDSQLHVDVELHDALVPRGVESVPTLQEMHKEGRRIQQPRSARDGVRQDIENAAAQALRRDDGRGIDAPPAASFDPNFRPGVGI